MSKNSTHTKMHNLVGYGLIIRLPFVLISAAEAVTGGSQGFVNWLGSTSGGVGFMAFFTSALWYSKLEFDEVIMDYFGGKLRSVSLITNRLLASIVWVIAAYTIFRLTLGTA